MVTTLDIITVIGPLALIAIAAASNAVWQTTNEHYSVSIFDDVALRLTRWGLFRDLLSAKQWFNYDGKSWLNKYVDRDPTKGYVQWTILGYSFTKPVQLTDSFHFFIMLEAGFYLLAPALLFLLGGAHSILETTIFFVALSTIRNWVFNLFYNHLLRK